MNMTPIPEEETARMVNRAKELREKVEKGTATYYQMCELYTIYSLLIRIRA